MSADVDAEVEAKLPRGTDGENTMGVSCLRVVFACRALPRDFTTDAVANFEIKIR